MDASQIRFCWAMTGTTVSFYLELSPDFLSFLPSFLPSFFPFFLSFVLSFFRSFLPSFPPSLPPSLFPSFLPSFLLSFRAVPTAYGSSQARGRIGAVAAGLHQSHSYAGQCHIYDLPHSSQQLIVSPLSKARDQTCVFMDPSWDCYHWAMTVISSILFLNLWVFHCLLHSQPTALPTNSWKN